MLAPTFFTPGMKIYLKFHWLSLPVQTVIEQQLLQADMKEIPLSHICYNDQLHLELYSSTATLTPFVRKGISTFRSVNLRHVLIYNFVVLCYWVCLEIGTLTGSQALNLQVLTWEPTSDSCLKLRIALCMHTPFSVTLFSDDKRVPTVFQDRVQMFSFSYFCKSATSKSH